MSLTSDGPRYDSKPTQPNDLGDYSLRDLKDAHEAALESSELAAAAGDILCDQLTYEEMKKIVKALFSYKATDYAEVGRIIHVALRSLEGRIDKETDYILENEKLENDG